ncbi:MAG: HAD family hydrolase [Terriglobales bacterium]
MPIEAIIFDLGNTLVPFSLERLQPWLKPCRSSAESLMQQFELGEVEPGQFKQAMCRLMRMKAADFSPWWNSIFESEWLVPQLWIERLMGRYRVGLMSNTNPLHFAWLERRHPLLGRFAFRILSHEVGAAKPAPLIYQAAEQAAGCRPASILYLDDIAEFVAAARRRGWQAEQFRGATAFARLAARHHLGLRAPARRPVPAGR